MPDDFDYNDMVLRISKKKPEIGNSYVIDLTVTLEACGAGELYAGAIQLDGIRTADIESVEIVGGKPMDDGYPTSPTYITDNSVLQSGRNGAAVIRLFDCAQWAISKQQDNVGDIAVIRYNTEPTNKENYSAKVSPVTTTYRITFKNSDTADGFTLENVDPFLIHEYNTGFFEVHTYDHKFDLCISPINTNMLDYGNNVSWAVVIPKGDFRYPIEGTPLCIYSEDIDEYYGPYEGFAKWIKDCDTNHDWYKTVTDATLVY
jgi:LruC domain-containing protein